MFINIHIHYSMFINKPYQNTSHEKLKCVYET